MIADLAGQETGAVLSELGEYRYRLWRRWDQSKMHVLFIMLNPSTADENSDDPTIRRCTSFAHYWGYGGIEVCNLFALRTTDPKLLYKHPDPVGPQNDAYLIEAAHSAHRVVCAWGNHGLYLHRAEEVCQLMRGINQPLDALKLTKKHMPQHPLYLKSDARPKSWRGTEQRLYL